MLARSSIVKARAHTASRSWSAAQQTIEKLAAASEPVRRIRESLERPSEVGFRRRILRFAAEELHSWAPGAAAPTVRWRAGGIPWERNVVARLSNNR